MEQTQAIQVTTKSNRAIELFKIGTEYRADSRTVAPGIGIEHETFIKTLRTYQNRLETLGVFRFEIGKPTPNSSGGRPEIYIMLNRNQIGFAITLSRNTPQVVDFKLDLIEAFDLMAEQESIPLQGFGLEQLLTMPRLEFNQAVRRMRKVRYALIAPEPEKPKVLLAAPKEPKPVPTIQDKIMEVFSKQPRGTLLKSYDICRLGGTQLRHAGTDIIRQAADELVTVGLLTKEGSGKSALYGLITK